MKKEVKEALNTLKTFLGMEIKLEQMKLKDGVTVLEFEVLEKDQPIFIVNEEERVALPIGDYELEDGQVISIKEEGIISEIVEKQEEVNEESSEVVEEKEDVEMEKEKPVKKTVESQVKETFFSKEEKEKLEKEVEDLKAKVTELSEVEEPKVELKEEEVKPIVQNPENKKEIEVVKLGKSKSKVSQILEKVYN